MSKQNLRDYLSESTQVNTKKDSSNKNEVHPKTRKEKNNAQSQRKKRKIIIISLGILIPCLSGAMLMLNNHESPKHIQRVGNFPSRKKLSKQQSSTSTEGNQKGETVKKENPDRNTSKHSATYHESNSDYDNDIKSIQTTYSLAKQEVKIATQDIFNYLSSKDNPVSSVDNGDEEAIPNKYVTEKTFSSSQAMTDFANSLNVTTRSGKAVYGDGGTQPNKKISNLPKIGDKYNLDYLNIDLDKNSSNAPENANAVVPTIICKVVIGYNVASNTQKMSYVMRVNRLSGKIESMSES